MPTSFFFVFEKNGDLKFQKSELLKEHAQTVERLFAENALLIMQFVIAICTVLSAERK